MTDHRTMTRESPARVRPRTGDSQGFNAATVSAHAEAVGGDVVDQQAAHHCQTEDDEVGDGRRNDRRSEPAAMDAVAVEKPASSSRGRKHRPARLKSSPGVTP